MTRREAMERRRRKRQAMRIRKGITVSVFGLLAIAVLVVAWNVLAPIVGKGMGQTLVAQAAVIGDGDAVRTTYVGEGGSVGWNYDDTGWWFLNDDNTYFASGFQTIDGKTYYFKEDGRIATGWTEINGESYFFKVDGEEDPEASQKLIALTFDDGPSESTARILDCLEANGAKATFFVVGTQAEYYSDTLKREDALGMEIGNHTYDHTYLYDIDAAMIQAKMQQNDEALTNIIGHGTTIMRPTGGGVTDTMRTALDKPIILWDVDTLDWETKDANTTVQNILEQAKDGSIVLMHDMYSATADAVEIIVPELIKQGYKLVTVSELAERRGVTLVPGQVYNGFYPPEGMTDEATETPTE